MGDVDDTTAPASRMWNASYSEVTIREAQSKLGFGLGNLEANTTPVKSMLDSRAKLLGEHALKDTKLKVYERIVEYLEVEGYFLDSEYSRISDLVYSVTAAILSDFKSKAEIPSLYLQRGKETVSANFQTGGVQEFVVADLVSVIEDRSVLVIVEARRRGTSFGEAVKRCLLAMRDMRERNGGVGEVYGFVTAGDIWRMIRYGGSFEMTDTFSILFGRMAKDKQRWMKEFSILVECMVMALSHGGVVQRGMRVM